MSLRWPTTTGYAGPDRRSRTPEPSCDRAALRSATVLLLGLLALAAALSAHDGRTWSPSMVVGLELARLCTVLSLLSGGVLLLVLARRTGRASPAVAGAALVALSVCLPVLPPAVAGPTVGAVGLPEQSQAALHVVALGAAGGALWRATQVEQVRTRLRGVRLAVGLALVAGAVHLAVVLAGDVVALPGEVTVALRLVCCVAWVVLAVRLWRRPGTLTCAVSRPLAALAAGWAASVAAGLLAGADPTVTLTGALVRAGLALVLAVLVAVALHGALATEAARERAVQEQLRRREVVAAHERARLHDARAALAGVRCATDVLHRRAGRGAGPGDHETEELRQSVAAELRRVERLLLPEADATATAQPVARIDDVLRPLVVTMRERRTTVRWEPSDLVVAVAPDVLARVLLTLVDNAHRHAPGATVDIGVRVEAGLVLVDVRDDGPGVDPAVRGDLFLPGVRRAGSAGEGIGLAWARSALRAAGGDLRLLETARGAHLRCVLPVAGTARGRHAAPLPRTAGHPLA